jgi:hypothetical protein
MTKECAIHKQRCSVVHNDAERSNGMIYVLYTLSTTRRHQRIDEDRKDALGTFQTRCLKCRVGINFG